jgi:hypothetical protein
MSGIPKFMKLQLIIIFAFINVCKILSQDIVPISILKDIFHIKKDTNTGTSFIISKNKKNYLITAKHLFKGINNGQNIDFEIEKNAKWEKIYGNIYFDTTCNADIVLISSPYWTNVESSIYSNKIISFLGDEGYFLGFPHNLKSEDINNLLGGYSIPLVKKVMQSGRVTENNISIIYLDGHNNPGFSGGPVLFFNRNSPSDKNLYLIGVINGYISSNKENTGIIIAHSIKHIYNILDQIK